VLEGLAVAGWLTRKKSTPADVHRWQGMETAAGFAFQAADKLGGCRAVAENG